MRKWPLLAAVLALLLLPVSPASAKLYAIESLTISGPGIEGSLVLERDRFERGEFAALDLSAGIFTRSIGTAPGPSEDLGPRYVVETRMSFYVGSHKMVEVVQYLYPFAAEPVIFTPRQQLDIERGSLPKGVRGLRNIHSDWRPIADTSVTKLQQIGLPDGPPTDPAPSERSASGSWPVMVTALVLLAAFRPVTRAFHRSRPARV